VRALLRRDERLGWNKRALAGVSTQQPTYFR
jgi:hypothetical protein